MFGIASFGWTIDDPDGLLNVRSTQIAFNDTSMMGDIPLIPLIMEHSARYPLIINRELKRGIFFGGLQQRN